MMYAMITAILLCLFYFVCRLDVCHDHSYFATCSDDGQVKIWECGKLEGKNVANRSKQTLNKQGMSICEKSSIVFLKVKL